MLYDSVITIRLPSSPFPVLRGRFPIPTSRDRNADRGQEVRKAIGAVGGMGSFMYGDGELHALERGNKRRIPVCARKNAK